MVFNAIETQEETTDALASWKRSFSKGAKRLPWGSKTVLWHEELGVWGYFGETARADSSLREWNVFGEVPHGFKQNMIVEINPPRSGSNLNLQGVFARDRRGRRWLLHQGRMSVPGKRIKQADFAALTGLTPSPVAFATGRSRAFHPVACLDGTPERLRRDTARFVRACAAARARTIAAPKLAKAIGKLPALIHSLKPEKRGGYHTHGKAPGSAKRRHADVWKALAAELDRRTIEYFNTRIKGYGPDLFTLEEPLVLFEIKSNRNPADIFAAVGQLDIYEVLLENNFRKVLVVPEGMSETLRSALLALNLQTVVYRWQGRRPVLDRKALERCLS